MKKIFILAMCLVLLSSTCQKDKNNHFYITVQNQSDNDVYLAHKGVYSIYEKCFFDTITKLKKHSVFEYQPYNWSIERVLGRGSSTILELFVANDFQTQNLYDCDSILIQNNILKHYQLTLEDLKQNNFTIIYP